MFREQRSLQVASILARPWEENYIKNRPRIEKCMGNLDEERWDSMLGIRNDPILVVGAGPSVEKNLDDINPDGRYNLAVCDKMCPALAKRGIMPDLIFALNAEPTSVRKWLEPMKDSMATLVMPCGVHPDTYADWTGKLFFVNAHTPTGLGFRIQHELDYPPVSIGSNVGTFAYTMCGIWGANPIAYMGLDFSFLTRSEVMSKYDAEEYDPKYYNILEMTDINGDVRYLDLGWFDMAQAFQERVRMFKEQYGVRTINCTEGGINYSDYTEVMTMKDFNEAMRRGNL